MMVAGYTEGMTKEDLLEERKAAAASNGSSRVQAPRSRAGWGNSHIRRKALVSGIIGILVCLSLPHELSYM